MGFVRRHRFAIELALLALVAYLPAAGVTPGLGTAVDDVPSAPAEAAAAITPHLPGSLADYALIAERDLFNPARGGGEGPRSPAGLRLWGVGLQGREARAVIEDGATHRQELYRVGDQVGGARIASIDWDRVTLEGDGGEEVLELSPPAAPPSPDTPDPLAASAPAAEEATVALNFQDVELPVLARFVSEVTGRNFIVDDRVRGKVTIISPTRITPDEAYLVFQSVLQVKGFTTVPSGAFTKIVPAREALASGTRRGDEVVTRILPLGHAAADGLVRVLAQLVGQPVGPPPEPQPHGSSLARSSARRAEALGLGYDGGLGQPPPPTPISAAAEPPPAGTPSAIPLAAPVRLTADPATNTLVVSATPEDWETLRAVIEQLDVRRRQVFVEAIILEATLEKTRALGVEFRVGATDDGHQGLAQANLGTLASALVDPTSLPGLILAAASNQKVKLPNGQEVPAHTVLLTALQTDSDVNVLSAPNIITTDNQAAEIVRGRNVPFVASRATSATNLPNLS